MKTKEEYEKIINNSPLFDTVDRESCEYDDERKYLMNIIVEYYKFFIWKKKDKDDLDEISLFNIYGLELFTAINACLQAYTKESGNFINYLGTVTKFERKKALAKENTQNVRGGIKICGKDSVLIRKINCIFILKEISITDSTKINKIAQMLGISTERVTELITIYNNTYVRHELKKTENSDEKSIFDKLQINEHLIPDIRYLSSEELLQQILQISTKFLQQSVSVKKNISAILTLKFIQHGAEELLGIEKLVIYPFFNKEMYDWQKKSDINYSDKEIAEKLGVSPAYLCKIKKNFFEEIKTKLYD